MKRLLLILLCFPLMTLAQKTYVPDDSFEQALISLGYDNVLDDSVVTASIDTITSLDISHLGDLSVKPTLRDKIYDLKGIENFTALEELYCQDNHLTSLDLSQNTNLTYLNCSRNLWLQCISVVDPVWSTANWEKDSLHFFKTSCTHPSLVESLFGDCKDQICSQNAITKFLQRNLNKSAYPDVEGEVLLEFIIEKDGSVSSVKLISHLTSDYYLNFSDNDKTSFRKKYSLKKYEVQNFINKAVDQVHNECYRVIKSMKFTTPSKVDGKAVRSSSRIPFNFSLN